jgi:hypothetical protein
MAVVNCPGHLGHDASAAVLGGDGDRRQISVNVSAPDVWRLATLVSSSVS